MRLDHSNLNTGWNAAAPDHYYEVEMTPRLRDFTLRLIQALGPTPARTALVEAFETARRIDSPLLRRRLDWDQLEAEAQRMGCSQADRIWDLGRSKD